MSLLDVAAKIILDSSGYVKGITEAEGVAGKFGAALSGSLKAAAKASVAALSTVSGAVVAITKKSLDAYADYEQLTGGVETLFGTQGMSIEEYAKSVGKSVDQVKGEYAKLQTAQSEVMANAANAYKTAGLSANEYMETVTSFSASLIQSVGGDTVKAAELADQAIVDMADNANKMGTSMESIQNAYQGFAKQNYTMLDNLKLGYGGTKEEMERLLADAEAISGVHYDISSYADVVSAIHVIQTEMGITGTTAKEAASTISGSINMTKAAWQNLLTGFGDENADLGALVDNLVDSATTAIGNIGNRVKVILPNLAKGLTELVSAVVPVVSDLMGEFLPPIIDGATKIIQALVEALPSLIQVLIDSLPTLLTAISEIMPMIISAGGTLINGIVQGITEALPVLVNQAPTIISSIVSAIFENLETLTELGAVLINTIVQAIQDNLPAVITGAVDIITKLVDVFMANAETLLGAGLFILQAIVEGLMDNLPELLQTAILLITYFVDYLVENLPSIINFALYLVQTIALGLVDAIPQLADAAVEIITKLADFLVDNIGEIISTAVKIILALTKKLSEQETLKKLLEAAVEIILALAGGIVDSIPEIFSALDELVEKIVDFVVKFFTDDETKQEFVDTMCDLGKKLVTGLWDGVIKMKDWFVSRFKGFFGEAEDSVKTDQEIHSPSRRWANKVGKPIGQGVGVGAVEGLEEAQTMIDDAMQGLTDVELSSHISTSTGTMSGLGDGIDELIEMFKYGTAKTSVENTRDLRRAVNA